LKTRSLVIVVLLAALLGAFGWYRWSERQVPAGQAPLATLGAASLDTLRTEFNAHADQVRIVVLLSPT
jgi:predicted negative regulator of RcsB-dependent stress response